MAQDMTFNPETGTWGRWESSGPWWARAARRVGDVIGGLPLVGGQFQAARRAGDEGRWGEMLARSAGIGGTAGLTALGGMAAAAPARAVFGTPTFNRVAGQHFARLTGAGMPAGLARHQAARIAAERVAAGGARAGGARALAAQLGGAYAGALRGLPGAAGGVAGALRGGLPSLTRAGRAGIPRGREARAAAGRAWDATMAAGGTEAQAMSAARLAAQTAASRAAAGRAAAKVGDTTARAAGAAGAADAGTQAARTGIQRVLYGKKPLREGPWARSTRIGGRAAAAGLGYQFLGGMVGLPTLGGPDEAAGLTPGEPIPRETVYQAAMESFGMDPQTAGQGAALFDLLQQVGYGPQAAFQTAFGPHIQQQQQQLWMQHAAGFMNPYVQAIQESAQRQAQILRQMTQGLDVGPYRPVLNYMADWHEATAPMAGAQNMLATLAGPQFVMGGGGGGGGMDPWTAYWMSQGGLGGLGLGG